jgi:malate dehydrogenase
MIACSVMLDGQYGLDDICIGVPCIIGKNGIEEILEIRLDDNEKAMLAKSAGAVRAMNGDLKNVLA